MSFHLIIIVFEHLSSRHRFLFFKYSFQLFKMNLQWLRFCCKMSPDHQIRANHYSKR
eukprot:UN11231